MRSDYANPINLAELVRKLRKTLMEQNMHPRVRAIAAQPLRHWIDSAEDIPQSIARLRPEAQAPQ